MIFWDENLSIIIYLFTYLLTACTENQLFSLGFIFYVGRYTRFENVKWLSGTLIYVLSILLKWFNWIYKNEND